MHPASGGETTVLGQLEKAGGCGAGCGWGGVGVGVGVRGGVEAAHGGGGAVTCAEGRSRPSGAIRVPAEAAPPGEKP